MSQISLNQAVLRIQENETRFNTFINGDENVVYTTEDNVPVKSIQNFISSKNAEINSSVFAPTLNFVGHFDVEPPVGDYLKNSVYKNNTNGNMYVLTGTPLSWGLYMESGVSWDIKIESTNGTIFRVGQSALTILRAIIFRNGVDVTDQVQESRFRWRRVSHRALNTVADDVWNASYSAGYKQIEVSVDDVAARATFYCDILES